MILITLIFPSVHSEILTCFPYYPTFANLIGAKFIFVNLKFNLIFGKNVFIGNFKKLNLKKMERKSKKITLKNNLIIQIIN